MKSSIALLVVFVLAFALSACHPPPRPPRPQRPPHPRGEMNDKKFEQVKKDEYRFQRIESKHLA